VENGRYDFQKITFQDLKNAPVIAVNMKVPKKSGSTPSPSVIGAE
jgi:hypothetical protein